MRKNHLVVRLSVRDGLLHPTPVDQGVDDVANVPLFVAALFEYLDPLVRYGHAQTVVETDASLFDWPAHTRHPGHVLFSKRPNLQ